MTHFKLILFSCIFNVAIGAGSAARPADDEIQENIRALTKEPQTLPTTTPAYASMKSFADRHLKAAHAIQAGDPACTDAVRRAAWVRQCYKEPASSHSDARTTKDLANQRVAQIIMYRRHDLAFCALRITRTLSAALIDKQVGYTAATNVCLISKLSQDSIKSMFELLLQNVNQHATSLGSLTQAESHSLVEYFRREIVLSNYFSKLVRNQTDESEAIGGLHFFRPHPSKSTATPD